MNWQLRIYNPETEAVLGTRHRTKTNETKKNTSQKTKNAGVNTCSPEG